MNYLTLGIGQEKNHKVTYLHTFNIFSQKHDISHRLLLSHKQYFVIHFSHIYLIDQIQFYDYVL